MDVLNHIYIFYYLIIQINLDGKNDSDLDTVIECVKFIYFRMPNPITTKAVRKPSPAAGGGDSRKSPLNHPGGVSAGKTRLNKPPPPTKGMRKSPSTLIPIVHVSNGTHSSKTKPRTNSASSSPSTSHMNFQSLLLSESERYPQQHPSDNADDYGHDLALQALVSQQIQDDLAQNQRSGSATSAPMAIPSTGSSNQYGAHGVGPNAPLCGVGFVGGVGFDVDDDDLDLDDEGDADAQAAGAGDDDDEDPLDRDPDDEVIYDDDGSSEEDSNYDSNDELEVNWTNFTYVSAPSSFGNKYTHISTRTTSLRATATIHRFRHGMAILRVLIPAALLVMVRTLCFR